MVNPSIQGYASQAKSSGIGRYRSELRQNQAVNHLPNRHSTRLHTTVTTLLHNLIKTSSAREPLPWFKCRQGQEEIRPPVVFYPLPFLVDLAEISTSQVRPSPTFTITSPIITVSSTRYPGLTSRVCLGEFSGIVSAPARIPLSPLLSDLHSHPPLWRTSTCTADTPAVEIKFRDWLEFS
ncbi:hypothetical protein VTI28DRAFT_7117 [Corynascus sepedonium]